MLPNALSKLQFGWFSFSARRYFAYLWSACFCQMCKFVRCNAKKHKIQVQLLFRKFKHDVFIDLSRAKPLPGWKSDWLQCKTERWWKWWLHQQGLKFFSRLRKTCLSGLVLGKQPMTSHWRKVEPRQSLKVVHATLMTSEYSGGLRMCEGRGEKVKKGTTCMCWDGGQKARRKL